MTDDPRRRPSDDPFASLAGGGDMGSRIRDFAWSTTPLGPIDTWPQSLRSALSICLNSNFPIAVYWGRDLVLLYNDEWSPIPGEKHPWALGRPAREAWPEIWHIIEPLFRKVMETGEATRSRDQLLPMHRHGFTEECYFDYTFSPVRGERGEVEGVFNAVLETTTRVIGERRLRTLRELGAWKTGEARTAEEACQTATHTLAANPYDLPFTLLYLLDDRGRAQLAGLTGLPRDTRLSAATVDLEVPEAPWPFQQVAQTCKAVEVDSLPAKLGALPGGAWPEPARQAVVLPVMKSGQAELAGFVVAGVSPRLALDDDYRGFLDLLAGHVAAAISSARAYEEERRRSEALAELDRAKTAFFSNVSHEFRTPLTLMLGPAEDALADSQSRLPDAQRERVEVILRNGLRLQRLVNTLLEFSRIEAGRVRATFEPTNLAEFTADLASNFRSACDKAGLKLIVDCPPLPEPVFVDPQLYERIVLNLLSNAFKFTFAGEIAVSLRLPGQEEPSVELHVRDTGTGVPAEELPRLFERFHRVEKVQGRTHEGSGIGLALVQELVKLHGGSITVASEPGQGTEFVVTLPRGAGHLPPSQVRRSPTAPVPTTAATSFVQEALQWLPRQDAASSRASLQDQVISEEHVPFEEQVSLPWPDIERVQGDRPRILVADDNADMRRYLERLLSGAFTVEDVPDGAAALAAARRQRPDLILSDVMMPRLDGFGLLRELRTDPKLATIPVILLSARAGEESRVEGVEAGADEYLIKPFSARELLARVTAQVQMARLRQEVNESLRQNEEYLRAIVETTPACIKVVAPDGTLISMNAAGLAMVEAERPEEVEGGCVYNLICPHDREAFREFNERVCRGEPGRLQFEIEGLRGTRRHMETHAAPLRGSDGQFRQLAITHDITARKRAEALQAGQRRILELIARNTPLPEVLREVCRLIEEQEPGLLCSILLTDDGGRHTGAAFGPSLPDEFVRALQGIEISPPHVGSCCRALDSGHEVVVADIEHDGRWSPLWRDLNLAHGLRACRSIPIGSSDGKMVASVAVFRRVPGDPGPANRELLGIATHLAGAAIERRRAEEVLRESEARFRQLADAMPQIVWTARPDGQIDYRNHRWTEFTELPDDIGNQGWSQFLHPDDAPAAKERWAASLRSGEPFEMEIRLFDRREQAYRWYLIRTAAARDDAGQVIRWFGTGTDIHQQKRAEESSRYLAEASAALAGVVDYESTLQKVANLAVPYFSDWSTVDVAEGEGQLRRLAVAHQDREKIDLVQRLMREYPPDPQAPVGAHAVHRTGKPLFIAEITDDMLVASARDERHLELMRSLQLKSYICVPLIVSGKALGVLTFATAESGRRYGAGDLTLASDLAQRAAVAIENTQLYQALRDADRRKDEFLATLAHELRNPLAPLRNGLQVLRLAGSHQEMAEQARTMMERQLGQMVHLIDDLLDLSRISRGKIELRKERVELARIIQQAVETSRPAVEQAGHEFLIDVPQSPIFVDADVTRLAQVFSNLLNNAAKYTERGGQIRLTVQRQAGEVVTSVRDTGVGIPASMLPQVFEMFTQVDRNLERAQGGLGIGLSIVKRLVEMHGGSVEARSDGQGMGSEFVVRLPVVLSVVQPQDGAPLSPPPATCRRVLIVDDNRDAAVSLAMMLELMGNETRTAHDGLEALQVAAAYRPELILLDIGMPKMNGYDTARQIRQQAWGRNIFLVALTGWGQDEDRRRSQENGFDAHMIKPIEPTVLEKLLANLKGETG